MDKILTIAVPSYNAQDYLLETIPTMANVPNSDRLEIIIVNDGSKDNTLSVAEELRECYPKVVTIINKENGGHGSTINAAIPVAKGKYFKVVDADDWVETDNLSALIDYLSTCDDDEVITDYHRVYVDRSEKELVSFSGVIPNRSYSYDEFLKKAGQIPEMHSKTTKTSILQENEIRLTENCFYVDMEFITYPMPYITTTSYFSKSIYQYRLGTVTQSVNINSFIRNEKMHEKVLFNIIEFYKTHKKNFSQEKQELLLLLITRIVSTHYNIFFAKSISLTTYREMKRIEIKLSEIDSDFVTHSFGKKVKLFRKFDWFAYLPIAISDHLKYKLKK